jgi:cyclopropane fatty-acyl-phospholipid synthase-like methyltransferase
VSPEKIRLLGDHLRLTNESRVLDSPAGRRAGSDPRGAFGCRVCGIEIRPAFAEEARRRATADGLESLVEVETADASALEIEPESFDAVLCLGAAFVWGTMPTQQRPFAPWFEKEDSPRSASPSGGNGRSRRRSRRRASSA